MLKFTLPPLPTLNALPVKLVAPLQSTAAPVTLSAPRVKLPSSGSSSPVPSNRTSTPSMEAAFPIQIVPPVRASSREACKGATSTKLTSARKSTTLLVPSANTCTPRA